MKVRIFLSIPFLFIMLFPFPVEGQNHSVQLRMNMIGNHHGFLPNAFKDGINSHPFGFRKDWSDNEGDYNTDYYSHYAYYYLGAGYKYFWKKNFFRFKIDRLYFYHASRVWSTLKDSPSGSAKYTYSISNWKHTFSSMQYTVGAGKVFHWKIFDFQPGVEMFLFNLSDKEVFFYITRSDTSGTLETPYYYMIWPGGSFMGISLLCLADINLSEHISIALEVAGGIGIISSPDPVGPLFHYPSLSLCYSFGASERNVLFTPKKN